MSTDETINPAAEQPAATARQPQVAIQATTMDEADKISKWQNDLLRMLNHAASRSDISLKPDLIAAVLDGCGDETPTITPKLVDAYDKLTVAIRPATAASLAYAELYGQHSQDGGAPGFRLINPNTPVFWAKIFLFLVFLAVLALQVHTFIGSSLLSGVVGSPSTVPQTPPHPEMIGDLSNWTASLPSRTAALFHLGSRGETAAADAVNRAGIVLSVLNNYLLPTLYGLLGASAYIVRIIYERISNKSLLPHQSLAFNLRRMLGMILGFASGLFWEIGNPGLSDGKTLSLAAFAFLMGYGIEAMFPILDALVNKIRDNFKDGGKGPPAPSEVGLST